MFKIIGIKINKLDIENTDIKANVKFGETALDKIGFDLKKKYFDYQKNLKEGFFMLDNSYSIIQNDNQNLILNSPKEKNNLYSFSESLHISCNAIVGKNGSGKSTLIEVFYLMIYNLSVRVKVLNPTFPSIDDAKLHYMPYLKAQLIYVDDEGLKLLVFDISKWNDKENENFIHFHKGIEEYNQIKFDYTNDQFNSFDLQNFCYSIGMNYSVFGMNNSIMGNWIQQLFHKNDGYQTPIVLNPYKENGQYDIFHEINLNKERLILNSYLFNSKVSEFYVSSDYSLIKVECFFIPGLKKIKNDSIFNECLSINSENKEIKISDINPVMFAKYIPINLVIQDNYNGELRSLLIKSESPDLITFFSFQCSRQEQKVLIYKILKDVIICDSLQEISSQDESADLINELIAYIIYKIYRIGYTYNKFFPSIINHSSRGLNPDIFKLEKNGKSAIENLILDNSHKTLKLRRAILLLRNLKNLQKTFTLSNGAQIYILDSKYFQSIANVTNISNLFVDPLTFLLPSLFNLQISLHRKKNDKNNRTNSEVSLEVLSSGELQLILSIHTLLYHILNLNSNHPKGSANPSTPPYYFKNILVLLDEIELYFHPEYQKMFVNELIQLLEKFESNIPKIKSIQFIFSTHSPFILSDIPAQYVLRLNDGKKDSFDSQKNTFAANIHNLLKDEFFLKDGTIGNYAKGWVRDLITEINELKDYDKEKIITINEKISLIGEELLRNSIQRLLNGKIQNPKDKIEFLKYQISLLESEDEKN